MKSMNDVLPVELIQAILLRVPARHLFPLKLVSKLWLSLISHPNFVDRHSSALTSTAFFLTKNCKLARLVDLHALFDGDGNATKEVPIPLGKKKEQHYSIQVLGSCRGFVLLHGEPHFILWNPVTGYRKQVSHRCDLRNQVCPFLCAILYGFGYDASSDDYLVISSKGEDYIGCFPVRTNSWIKIDVTLPKPLRKPPMDAQGLYFNGAIHWLTYHNNNYEAILIFDVKQRSFSKIPLPEEKSMDFGPSGLVILRGCLVLYFLSKLYNRTQIWMMQDYKVHSSWILYDIGYMDPCSKPLCSFNGSDFIMLNTNHNISKYSVEGELLQHFQYYRHAIRHSFYSFTLYTESIATLPCDKKKWAKNEFGFN